MQAKPDNLRTLADYARAARDTLSESALEYLEGGVAAGVTLAGNRTAFDRIQLNPRVLVDVTHIDTSLQLLGAKHAFPILLAPTGYHKLFHPEGELETVRGAALSGAHLIAACFSTVSFAEMARAAPAPLSFQLYFQQDRRHTRMLVEQVLKAGCAALCVTVDVPVNGPRDREDLAPFSLPAGVQRCNLSFLGEQAASAPHRPAGRAICSSLRAFDATWADLEWLRSVTPVPLLIKGVLNPDDAERAANCGCDAVVVSNHGGRSVDTVPAAISALPRIVERVGKRLPVLVDGGIRRGTDVFKALALGASAVLIGRPYLHGLAVAGAPGVAQVIDILRTELEMTMGLMGCQNIAQITAQRLWSGDGPGIERR